MYLERLLQINMATLAALGALLLGMGQRSEGPPLLVMLAAAVSVWLTDVTAKFRLGRWTANVLMLVGAVISLHDVYPPRSEAQTVGLSWFLIYLQIILLFQEKDQWKYWLLIMLSLLEVVLATLFSQGVWFGVLLAIYMLLGFSAMTLLMLYRQWEYYRKESGARGDGLMRDEQPPLAKPWFTETTATARWPLSAEHPEFASLPGGASHAGVGRNLVGRVARMGLQTMLLTCVLFFAIPRFGQVEWRHPVSQPNAAALVGFTDEVQLGELGSIIESRESVLKVQFLQGRDDAIPQQLAGDIYLQGAYLMAYRDGRWVSGMASGDSPGESLLQRDRPLPWRQIVRQKFTIEPLDRKELFYVAPYIAILGTYLDITFDNSSQRLLRSDDYRSKEFKYVLGTTAIVGGKQLPLSPAARNDLPEKETLLVPDNLPNLKRLAADWIKESKLPESDRRGRAEYLEDKLARSGLFQYSLGQVDRNRQIDPIEDFLTEHRQGHCEYSATALTLMLRSQGIPARMVSGFKIDSDAWNSAGGYYQVRQWHAHTWVEAYLWPSQAPDDMKHGKDYWTRGKNPDNNTRCWQAGAWLRLDPTPGGAAGRRHTWFTPVRNGFDWLQGAWSRYVVELDYKTQCDAIYQPIADAARGLWRSMIRSSFWEASEYVSVALYLDHLNREVKWTLLGVIGIAIILLVVGIIWCLFRFGRRLWARWTDSQPRRRRGRRVEIEFYRRFEHLLARQGLVRAVAQTQREFAAAAGAHLARLTGDSRLATLPALVADAFYRVRFGLAPLDNLQAQAVEQALAEIAAIRKDRASGKSRPSVAGA